MPFKDVEAKRKWQREWVAKRRSDFFKDKVCAQLSNECEGSLELDHINPSEKKSHKIWSWCEEKREAEIAKCQTLCSFHHMKKTANDILDMKTRAHGTQDGYSKWRCRCELCMKYKTPSDEHHAGMSIDFAKEIAYA